MSNNYNGCNNNCEAVAGLLEKAANLVAYANLINSWLNGPATGTVNIAGTNTPILLKLITDLRTKINQMPQSILLPNGGIKIDSNGKLYIDFNSMPPALLYDLLQNIILEGGGLSFNTDGKMYVDFSDPSNQAQLDKLKLELDLQYYLQGNTTFYVRKSGASGYSNISNTVPKDKIKTWGTTSSSGTAFATIQGAINHVTKYFNIGGFTAIIDVGSGVYEESVTLNNFNRTTGKMVLKGNVGAANALATTIKKPNQRLLYTYAGSAWEVANIKLQQEIAAGITRFTTAIDVAPNSELTLERFELLLEYDGSNVPANANHRPINVDGNLYMKNTSNTATGGASKITTTGYNQGMGALLRVGGTGYVEMRGESTAFPKILCSGGVSAFAVITGGRFAVNTGYTAPLGFQDDGVTGRRFRVLSGGQCTIPNNSEGNTDLQYFPGDEAGTIETSTYSWYK